MPSKGILYYTDNQLEENMANTCREYIKKANLPITSVSLKPLDFGHNIHLDLERGYKTMALQILTGLENMTEDIVFFCEHDDLYPTCHFDFTPENRNTWYYYGNYWFIRMTDGFAIHYDVSPLSGLCVYRDIAITHYKERLALIEKQGFGYYMGFEPMTHNRIKWENKYPFEKHETSTPIVDFSHGGNLTKKRWSQDRFIKKPKFWEESDLWHIPEWPELPEITKLFFPIKV